MGAVGIQPRGEQTSSRGINHVIVLKPCKIISTHFVAGDIITVEKSNRSIMPMTDGLTDEQQVGPTETLLDQLVRLKFVKPHVIRPGDKPLSARPKPAHQTVEDPRIEQAVNPAPSRSERAVGKPQRGAV